MPWRPPHCPPISLSVSAPPGLGLQAPCPSFPITGPLCLIVSVGASPSPEHSAWGHTPWSTHWLLFSRSHVLGPPTPDHRASESSLSFDPAPAPPAPSYRAPGSPLSGDPARRSPKPHALRPQQQATPPQSPPVVPRSGPRAFETLFSQPSTTVSLRPLVSRSSPWSPIPRLTAPRCPWNQHSSARESLAHCPASPVPGHGSSEPPLSLDPAIAPPRPGPRRYSPATRVAVAGGAGALLRVTVLLQGCCREGVEEAGGQSRPAQAAASPW